MSAIDISCPGSYKSTHTHTCNTILSIKKNQINWSTVLKNEKYSILIDRAIYVNANYQNSTRFHVMRFFLNCLTVWKFKMQFY